MKNDLTDATWAWQTFGAAQLGDRRRTSRLVKMGTAAAKSPNGAITNVFAEDAERQGAYDFVENEDVEAEGILESIADACAKNCADSPFVYVPVDGSSLTLIDSYGKKDFGPIGTRTSDTRGLKVINAIAVSPEGIPIGLCHQSWWVRADAVKRTAKERKKHNLARKTEDKETQRWLDTIHAVSERFAQANLKAWFVIDREADARPILLALAKSGHWFTVRSSWDRLVESTDSSKEYLRARMSKQPYIGSYELKVPSGIGRTAHVAHMVMRSAELTLKLRDKRADKIMDLPINVAWVCEQGTAPDGEKPLDWLLFTNHEVPTGTDVMQIILGYAQRWRIEEFHKTWKSGHCKVEETQLHSQRAVKTWATILAAVAMRIERLKYLSRNEPEMPASVELSKYEVRALILLKRKHKKRTETIPDTVPSIVDAVRWIAELGGYTGKSSGGPPGTITIARGLEKVRCGAEMLELIAQSGR